MTTDNVMIEVEDSKQQEHVLDNIDLSLLNSEINKRIINPISKRLYKTTCIRCDDNLLSGG